MNDFLSSVKGLFTAQQVVNLVLIIGFVIAIYVVTNRRNQDMMELVDRQWRLQDETFKKMMDAHESERQRHEENLKRLQTAIEDIQKRYDEQIRIVETKKVQQVNKLVESYDEDPLEMTKQLGEALGFTVVIPEKKK